MNRDITIALLYIAIGATCWFLSHWMFYLSQPSQYAEMKQIPLTKWEYCKIVPLGILIAPFLFPFNVALFFSLWRRKK